MELARSVSTNSIARRKRQRASSETLGRAAGATRSADVNSRITMAALTQSA